MYYFAEQAVREINKFGYRECVDRRLKTYKHMDGDDEWDQSDEKTERRLLIDLRWLRSRGWAGAKVEDCEIFDNICE